MELFNKKGVFPPEWVGNNKACFDFVIDYLKERNVIWNKEIKPSLVSHTH
jgi:lysine 6-dehydrogenase